MMKRVVASAKAAMLRSAGSESDVETPEQKRSNSKTRPPPPPQTVSSIIDAYKSDDEDGLGDFKPREKPQLLASRGKSLERSPSKPRAAAMPMDEKADTPKLFRAPPAAAAAAPAVEPPKPPAPKPVLPEEKEEEEEEEKEKPLPAAAAAPPKPVAQEPKQDDDKMDEKPDKQKKKQKAEPARKPKKAPARKPKQVPAAETIKTTVLVSGTGKRHRNYSDNIQGITRPAIRRLARRGGIKRISKDFYDEVRQTLKRDFLTKIIHDARVIASHSKQKTITLAAMLYALKLNGHETWGADVGKSYTFQQQKGGKAKQQEKEPAPAPAAAVESPTVS